MVTLEPDAFWGLTEVKALHLDAIPATRLTPFSFRGLSKVAHLYLRRTKVAVIEPHAFSGLVNVNYLHMDESKIRSIQVRGVIELLHFHPRMSIINDIRSFPFIVDAFLI